MDYKSLSNDIKIPSIGLGTWGIGGFRQVDTSSDQKSIDVMKAAIQLGYTHIDTAEIYGSGHSEELIGLAIKEFNREDLIITSKVAKENLGYDNVIDACKRSLDRLQTNYIDIYLIHFPNHTIPLQETMGALDRLVDQKLVKFIGVSNFSVAQMEEAQKYSKNKIIANQIPYNLATRNQDHIGNCINMESEIIPYCQENGIFVIAYRPIERGFLLKPHPILDVLAKKYNKSRAQIALNRLISKKNIVAIPKSIDIEHLQENIGAMGWKLSETDIMLLDESNFGNP